MIAGIGTDMAEVSRVRRAVEKGGFCKRFFTDAENEYFKSKNYSAQTVAANFAAKEAFSKALGTGIRGFALRDIEVLRDELGKPYINLYNSLSELPYTIFVSLTHTAEYAAAFVVLEKDGEV